jgi:hypothetical protein
MRFSDFLFSSGTKKTTEIAEDTEYDYNSLISEFSVVEYTKPDHLDYSIK